MASSLRGSAYYPGGAAGSSIGRDRRGVDGPDDAPLGDDPGDQLGRGDVEGGVVDGDPLGGGLPAEAVGDLARVALLDRDGRAVGERQVERARRRGDVERDAVRPGQQGDAVGADLVRGVAVGRDPVGADDDRSGLCLPS